MQSAERNRSFLRSCLPNATKLTRCLEFGRRAYVASTYDVPRSEWAGMLMLQMVSPKNIAADAIHRWFRLQIRRRRSGKIDEPQRTEGKMEISMYNSVSSKLHSVWAFYSTSSSYLCKFSVDFIIFQSFPTPDALFILCSLDLGANSRKHNIC